MINIKAAVGKRAGRRATSLHCRGLRTPSSGGDSFGDWMWGPRSASQWQRGPGRRMSNSVSIISLRPCEFADRRRTSGFCCPRGRPVPLFSDCPSSISVRNDLVPRLTLINCLETVISRKSHHDDLRTFVGPPSSTQFRETPHIGVDRACRGDLAGDVPTVQPRMLAARAPRHAVTNLDPPHSPHLFSSRLIICAMSSFS
ncbi:hypothetical protein MPTK1_6g08370 [Marchantia polymorpha subsp. ruderalis]|uniref:Uncharacterized protein n=2 Tax=Marchantia polymorpha TaxID=3197 RepID=A0AAF6BPV4_MARPO|nr:hypothetical protein MARPO_0060s0084 [Marchantia polymorpha]BBN14038.1 hypothetical protein Mp_6g08370 [Marchantia polymorpha subsp. ruderalis]|eukprot:PTQ37007.1 hypothetical protein MARPO_0060s0084 [Marchantia polymorpha]